MCCEANIQSGYSPVGVTEHILFVTRCILSTVYVNYRDFMHKQGKVVGFVYLSVCLYIYYLSPKSPRFPDSGITVSVKRGSKTGLLVLNIAHVLYKLLIVINYTYWPHPLLVVTAHSHCTCVLSCTEVLRPRQQVSTTDWQWKRAAECSGRAS